MMTWRLPQLVTSAGALASLVALIWVYQWATRNNSQGDSEQQRLIIGTMIACAVLALPISVTALLALDGHAVGRLVRGGAIGAFVAVVASSASTMLIAMAIAPATDPGEFGRPLFRIAYAGALAIAVAAGIAAAVASNGGNDARGSSTFAVAALAIALTLVAWAWLAVGSSELNQCVVNDEFPLATDHVCSGY
ncbi:MAG TPA: hypothetical protein VFH62_00015 [Dehalococcoidia bacterium]|jgi:hypothetical protein|nr:hypothetical protein [Dehalococcoidia bacterium]